MANDYSTIGPKLWLHKGSDKSCLTGKVNATSTEYADAC